MKPEVYAQAEATKKLFARAEANVGPMPNLDRAEVIQALKAEGCTSITCSGVDTPLDEYAADAPLMDLNSMLWDTLVLKEVARLEPTSSGTPSGPPESA